VTEGLLVLYLVFAQGEVIRFWEWTPSEATHEQCREAAEYWTQKTGLWAECGQEL
jgi:hypothetical protein